MSTRRPHLAVLTSLAIFATACGISGPVVPHDATGADRDVDAPPLDVQSIDAVTDAVPPSDSSADTATDTRPFTPIPGVHTPLAIDPVVDIQDNQWLLDAYRVIYPSSGGNRTMRARVVAVP